MSIPAIEERFLEPPGWRWDHFEHKGHKIRFGSVYPDKPKALVLCLPGLSEFSEKYFETARDCFAMNLGFKVIDWPFQGKSIRFKHNRHKRHSFGITEDLDILNAAINTGKPSMPHIMLAHSMGGNLGLRYLAKHPGIFACAGFSAPMIGIHALEKIPSAIAALILKTAQTFCGRFYVPGGGNWSKDARPEDDSDMFSSDKLRKLLHNQWSIADPELQVGNVTWSWLYEAAKSCKILQRRETLRSIRIPCLFATAGQEILVSNAAIKRAVSIMPNAKLLELPDSRHEILMERDEIRKAFLNAFFELVKHTI